MNKPIITVVIKDGLVQDVQGVPAAYELHVHDHDWDDSSSPAWDAQKGCLVTVFEGAKPPIKQSCKQRLPKELKGRIADLKKLWKLYCSDSVLAAETLGHIGEYGLGFDFVAAGTFDGQREGYFRYQLSWGGPSDEFRIFVNPDFSCHRIEYWFLDWFDGAHTILEGEKLKLLTDIYSGLFCDSGAAEARFEEAMR